MSSDKSLNTYTLHYSKKGSSTWDGAASNEKEWVGKSCGGNTTKIHLAVDSEGSPRYFTITGDDVHDSQAAPDLVEQRAKLLLLGYLFSVRNERQRIKEVQVNVAYRWFLDLSLTDIPKLLENAEFRVRLFLFRARRDDAHGCPL